MSGGRVWRLDILVREGQENTLMDVLADQGFDVLRSIALPGAGGPLPQEVHTS